MVSCNPILMLYLKRSANVKKTVRFEWDTPDPTLVLKGPHCRKPLGHVQTAALDTHVEDSRSPPPQSQSDNVTGPPDIDYNNSGSSAAASPINTLSLEEQPPKKKPTPSGKRPVSKAKKLGVLMKDCAQETLKQCKLSSNLLCYFCH